jgi:XTP/dITP diphosphohydrolase
LDGAPGVYSARYAGPQKLADDNMDLVLSNLNGESNRRAKFRTAIALIIDNKEHLFTGEVQGVITNEKSGAKGFGYDPIFKHEESNKTFAEFSMEEKNKISHRGIAVAKLVTFLQSSF